MKAWNLICDVSRKGILTLTMLDVFICYTPPQILSDFKTYKIPVIITSYYVFMPPTLKKLKGHIALGMSVCSSVQTKIKLGFLNFLDRFLSKK